MTLPKIVEDVLRVAAPTLAAGLAGPFAPIAASLATAALNAWLGPARGIVEPVTPAPFGAPQPSSVGAATPAEVVQAVQTNANDPRFLLDLRKVEVDLARYEMELGFRFSELEVKDRSDARAAARDTGLARPQFIFGMTVVVLSLLMLFGIVAGCILALTGKLTVDPAAASISIAAFGLLGTVTGVFQAVSAQILAFYFGSSAGSTTKSDQIGDTMRDLGQALGDAAKAAPVKPVPPVVVAPVPAPAPAPDGAEGGSTAPQPLPPQPAQPVPPGLLDEVLPELTRLHRQYEGSVEWMLTPTGISIDGAPAQGTMGEPATIRRLWSQYGDIITAAAKRYGLGVEAITATIACESGGNPSARRAEPQIKDQSVGLAQTLVATARQALGNRTLQADDLLDPQTSVMAGTAYMVSQRGITHLDPPKIACAYNSGTIRRDDGAANRWKMRCYPIGTGAHADRWVAWFNDSMRVSAEQEWGKDGTPSYVTALAARPN